jgi:hypothetical protein
MASATVLHGPQSADFNRYQSADFLFAASATLIGRKATAFFPLQSGRRSNVNQHINRAENAIR